MKSTKKEQAKATEKFKETFRRLNHAKRALALLQMLLERDDENLVCLLSALADEELTLISKFDDNARRAETTLFAILKSGAKATLN